MAELHAQGTREAIIEYTRRLADACAAAGPAADVPTAPPWTVADLVEHLGQTQNWVAEIIERRISDPTQLPMEMAERPSDAAAWNAWLVASATRVAEAFTDEALAADVFNPAADGRTGGQFWLTTMMNEAVVHGLDAAAAAGRPSDIDADVAAALITNHFRMLTSPTWAMQRAESANVIKGDGQTLLWSAGDAGEWVVTRSPEGATWRAGSAAADVTVSGPADALLMVLTRRRPLTDVTVDGDAALAQHWLDNTAHVAG